MARIITGKARGVRLVMPRGDCCRPTPGRTKEALFSILGDRVEGSRFLDVFAGSGQIGLEALSRGAVGAVMIERDRSSLAAIRENLRRTGLLEGARILAGDSRRRIESLAREGTVFDLIYLDPPWREAEALLQAMAPALATLLGPDGLLVVETDGQTPPADLFAPLLTWRRSCQYGTGVLSFYQFQPG